MPENLALVERTTTLARVRVHSGYVELYATSHQAPQRVPIFAAMLTPDEARQIAEALDTGAEMAERGKTSGA